MSPVKSMCRGVKSSSPRDIKYSTHLSMKTPSFGLSLGGILSFVYDQATDYSYVFPLAKNGLIKNCHFDYNVGNNGQLTNPTDVSFEDESFDIVSGISLNETETTRIEIVP